MKPEESYIITYTEKKKRAKMALLALLESNFETDNQMALLGEPFWLSFFFLSLAYMHCCGPKECRALSINICP